MTHYAYVGVPQWSAIEGKGILGGLFRQEVGGGDWRHLTTGLPDKVEVRAIAIHPRNPQEVYLGTQYGPYYSPDFGDHWESLDFPDSGKVVWSLLIHPHDPRILYLGTAPTAIYRSENGGKNWRRLLLVETAGRVGMAFPTRVIRLTLDPSCPEDLYAGLEVGGVIRSGDGGESWQDCTAALLRLAEQPHLRSQLGSDTDMEGMMDAHAVAVSPAQPGLVFLANRMGLFCSPDKGESWRELEIWRFSPFAYARDVQVAYHEPRTLYAALSPAAMSQAGAIYQSRDLGQTWRRFDHHVSPRRTMMAIAVSRQNPQCVYGINSIGQVFSTRDGGETWTDSPLPAGIRNVYALACG